MRKFVMLISNPSVLFLKKEEVYRAEDLDDTSAKLALFDKMRTHSLQLGTCNEKRCRPARQAPWKLTFSIKNIDLDPRG